MVLFKKKKIEKKGGVPKVSRTKLQKQPLFVLCEGWRDKSDLHHERQRPSGLNISEDELGQDIESDLVVRDSLNDSDGKGKHSGDEDSQ